MTTFVPYRIYSIRRNFCARVPGEWDERTAYAQAKLLHAMDGKTLYVVVETGSGTEEYYLQLEQQTKEKRNNA